MGKQYTYPNPSASKWPSILIENVGWNITWEEGDLPFLKADSVLAIRLKTGISADGTGAPTGAITGGWYEINETSFKAGPLINAAAAALAPSNPATGDFYFNSSDNNVYLWYSSAWHQWASGGGVTHAQLHSITSTADHSSTATSGRMLKADANGLPVNATNTDTDVADAVTKKHSQNTDTGTTSSTFLINSVAAIKEGDSRLADARTPLTHNQDASTITTGTLDGDRLPAMSAAKKGGVPPTGTPANKYLKDTGTWESPSSLAVPSGPTFPDWPTDGQTFILDSEGFHVYDATAAAWVQISGGVSGGTGVAAEALAFFSS